MSDQRAAQPPATPAWRRLLRLGVVVPLLVFATAFIALVYDSDVVNDAVKVQVVCDARVGAERLAAANAVGVEIAQVNCADQAAVQARRVIAAERFNRVFGLLLLLLTVLFVATRATRRVPIATLAVVFIVMALAGWKWPNAPMSPALVALKVPFTAAARTFENSVSVFGRYAHALLLGGLPEELYKSLPLLLIFWATMRGKDRLRARLGVAEPLDGIAINLAAAAGFVFAETYAPVARTQATQLLTTQMSVTHVVGGIAGQMAFSAIAGYFIALAMRGPRSRLFYIPAGLLVASVLHATWSAFAGLGGGQSDTVIATLIKVGAFFAALVSIELARGQTGWFAAASMADAASKAAPSLSSKGTPAAAPAGKVATPGSQPASPYKRYTPPSPAPVTPRPQTPGQAPATPASKPASTPAKPPKSTPASTPVAAASTPIVPVEPVSKPVPPPTITMRAADVAAYAPVVAATGNTGLNRAPLSARATPATSYVRLSTSANTFIHLNPGNVVRSEQWPGLASASNDGVVAQLLEHPDDPTQLALFNQSAETWVAWCAGDEFSAAIEPLTVLPLRDGLLIRTASGDVNVSMPAV